MNKQRKIKLLNDFFEKHKHLPEQNSKQWLEERKFFIGGSEVSTIAGKNPFKNIRGLIEGHLGLAPFSGNINTYWGSILEDYTVQILENMWGCKIRETGSLPGAIYEQKYSPDGLVYLEFWDQIVLLEIKNAIRRVANGRVPESYKPQIYTGLATIPIADRALFIDSMFRRCSLRDFNFTTAYDTVIHPKKPVNNPILLGAVFIYEDKYSGGYDALKAKYGKKGQIEYIDGGLCEPDDLATLLADAKHKKLVCIFPKTLKYDCDEKHECDEKEKTDEEKNISHRVAITKQFLEVATINSYTPICILPLKLFKFEIVPVERDDWKKKYNKKTRKYEMQETPYKNYVESLATTIRKVIGQIKDLDGLSPENVEKRLDELYPGYPELDEDFCQEIIKTMM